MKSIYKHIAITLKGLRDSRGWSLDKTAEITGVSKAMLGQIERQESSPTITTLWKIASGFNTPFSAFIEDIDKLDVKGLMHGAGKEKVLYPLDEKMRVLSLFPFDSQLNFEIYKIELLPGCEHLSPPHQPGTVEHVLVISGQIEVLVDGSWTSLKQGEGLKFIASKAHGYKNVTKVSAYIYDLVHYQK